jgi:hypothetical protein
VEDAAATVEDAAATVEDTASAGAAATTDGTGSAAPDDAIGSSAGATGGAETAATGSNDLAGSSRHPNPAPAAMSTNPIKPSDRPLQGKVDTSLGNGRT